MADWQTVLILIGAFAGVELLGAAINLATGGQVDIHNIAYDCSPERLVCPNTGFVNATQLTCTFLGCYDIPFLSGDANFVGYYTYDYAQKWDTDFGGTSIPLISDITGYEGTKHICLLNLNLNPEEGATEVLPMDRVVKVVTSVGSLNHTFEFKPYSYELPSDVAFDLDTWDSVGVYRLGCYTNKAAVGNNSVMYTGIIEDRTQCEAVGEKKFVRALEAEAWFPEGRYQCKRLDFWFFPMLLTFLIALPIIFAYYQAMGITQIR